MNSTARRVPRITGLPARILASTAMRSGGGIPPVRRGIGRFGNGSPLRLPIAFGSGSDPSQRRSLSAPSQSHASTAAPVAARLWGCVFERCGGDGKCGIPDTPPLAGDHVAFQFDRTLLLSGDAMNSGMAPIARTAVRCRLTRRAAPAG